MATLCEDETLGDVSSLMWDVQIIDHPVIVDVYSALRFLMT